ncbi:hypothetical protein ACPSL3_07695 [Vibrio owensii]|uniref:hypothetical protein n=1 Tax=Vibrio owensii TaxID=696485 RepID=UPI003CE5770D
MGEFITTNREEWLDLMSSSHQLKFDLELDELPFHSKVCVPDCKLPVPFVTTQTVEYTAKYKSLNNKAYRESFLLTHSFGRFKGSQDKEINLCNESFVLDLSKDFTGHFDKRGVTNAIILPFDLLPGSTVDCLKKQKGLSSPLFYAVEHILKNTNYDHENIINRLQCIMTNLSLIETVDKNPLLIEEIKFFMFQQIKKNEILNLDIVCEKFFMSRRKAQYLFQSNGTTFREIIKHLKPK